MIHLAHVRHIRSADHWIRRRRRQLEANPVPLLVIGVSSGHEELQALTKQAGVDKAFFVDASRHQELIEESPDVLVLGDRSDLQDARTFIDRAHRASNRLDILLVEDTMQPDLTWCRPYVDTFEAWA